MVLLRGGVYLFLAVILQRDRFREQLPGFKKRNEKKHAADAGEGCPRHTQF